MRIWSLAAAVIFALLNVGAALGENKSSSLKDARKFCAAKYGDRLLGVSLDGKNGFSCRFAAVTRTERFKLPSSAKVAKSQPAWDLDDEEGSSTAATTTSEASEETSSAALAPTLVQLPPQTKPQAAKKRNATKRRYKKRRSKKRRYRRKKRDPFAALFRNARKSAHRRKARRRHVRRYRTNVRRRRR